jgi:hypothetical protein
MSRYEIPSSEELSLMDEISLVLIQHVDEIYRLSGYAPVDIPDTELLFGHIKNNDGRSTQVALESAKFKDSEVVTLIVDDKRYIIGNSGVIPESFVGQDNEVNSLEIDLKQKIQNTVWGAIESGSPI